MKLAFAAAAALLATTALPASAATITYTFTGDFTGTIDGNAFTVPAVFTGIGDTANANNNGLGAGGVLGVPLTSLSALSGGITYTVTSPGAQFYEYGPNFGYNYPVGRVGFGFTGTNAVGLESDAFDNYSGLTSFGTTAAPAYYAANNGTSAEFDTDRGHVILTNVTGATFAAAVPEPASWAMMIGGFGLVGGAMRRRRAGVTTSVRYA